MTGLVIRFCVVFVLGLGIAGCATTTRTLPTPQPTVNAEYAKAWAAQQTRETERRTPSRATQAPVATALPRPTATASLPVDRETVSVCKATWEYILYVAEGYEIDGYSPSAALDMAILGVAEVYGVSVDALADCIEVLKQGGYDATQLQPRGP